MADAVTPSGQARPAEALVVTSGEQPERHPSLFAVLLFGPDGAALRGHIAEAAPFLCERSGSSLQYLAIGDPRAMTDEAKQIARTLGLDVDEITAEWLQEIEKRGDALAVVAMETMIAARNFKLERADLPCVVLCHEDGTQELVQIPILWSCSPGPWLGRIERALADVFEREAIRGIIEQGLSSKGTLGLLSARFSKALQGAFKADPRLSDVHSGILVALRDSESPMTTSDLAEHLQRGIGSLGRPLSMLKELCLVQNVRDGTGYSLTADGRRITRVLT